MPTIRPRHVVTETDQITQALDDAARRWPSDSGNRAKLLQNLIREGHQALATSRDHQTENRRAAITETSGALTGTFGRGYLAELREDWPE